MIPRLVFITGVCLFLADNLSASDYPFNYHRYFYGAEQGYAKSQYQLALLYMEGKYISLDYDTGLYWLKKAVEQDYPPALCSLAAIIAQGREGVIDSDEIKATQLLDKGISLSQKNHQQRFLSFCRNIKKKYQLFSGDTSVIDSL